MSDVASLELCKELYELSGWNNTFFWRESGPDGEYLRWNEPNHGLNRMRENGVPAYDLGYLLRKLPFKLTGNATGYLEIVADETHQKQYSEAGQLLAAKKVVPCWRAFYAYNTQFDQATADTPENATCKLAIELFKQNILKKKNNNEKN